MAPILISAYFIFACVLFLARPFPKPSPKRIAAFLALQLTAALLWYYSFVEHSAHIAAQGYDGLSYSWWRLVTGAFCGLAGLDLMVRIHTVWRK